MAPSGSADGRRTESVVDAGVGQRLLAGVVVEGCRAESERGSQRAARRRQGRKRLDAPRSEVDARKKLDAMAPLLIELAVARASSGWVGLPAGRARADEASATTERRALSSILPRAMRCRRVGVREGQVRGGRKGGCRRDPEASARPPPFCRLRARACCGPRKVKRAALALAEKKTAPRTRLSGTRLSRRASCSERWQTRQSEQGEHAPFWRDAKAPR